jgi:hypothetical protein
MTAGRDRGHPRSRRLGPASTRFAASIAIVGAFLAACGGTPPSLPGLPTSSPAAPVSEPPDGSGGPRPTAWTGNAALGIEALGLADSQILEALADLGQGIANEDLGVIRTAAEGLAGLDVLLPNVEKIRPFAPMAPFADQYEAAITAIDAAAQDVVDAIDAQDPAAITTTTQALVDALGRYSAVQPQLAAFIEQLPEQRRLLLR